MKAMLIDIDRCNGCHCCQIACKDEHVGNDWTPIAKPQPDIGQFWMKVTDIVQGTVPKVRVRYMHDICQHCGDAPCISSCKTHAIYKRDDGIVIIDPEKCTGGRLCMDACPYGAIYFNPVRNTTTKCDFCSDALDLGMDPACVSACPNRALGYGEFAELKTKYGNESQVFPLPLPSGTTPALVLIPHRNAALAANRNPVIANREEV